MVAPEVQGIDLFKIANRSISGWVPSFKMGSAAAPVKLPFCSQLEERLILWFEYHPHHYLPDIVGMLTGGQPFIAEAGMEDDKRGDRNLAKAEAARRLACL